MSFNRNHEISDRIMEQAAQWFARCRAEDFTKEQQTCLDEWLKADPDHRAAFDETQAAWDEIGHLAAPCSASSVSVAARRALSFRLPRFGVAGLALMAGLFFCAFYLKADLITWRNLNIGEEISYKSGHRRDEANHPARWFPCGNQRQHLFYSPVQSLAAQRVIKDRGGVF